MNDQPCIDRINLFIDQANSSFSIDLDDNFLENKFLIKIEPENNNMISSPITIVIVIVIQLQ